MEIPLKHKYTVGGWAKKVSKKAGGTSGTGKKHHKLSDKQKKALPLQPRMVLHIGPTGKQTMIQDGWLQR